MELREHLQEPSASGTAVPTESFDGEPDLVTCQQDLGRIPNDALAEMAELISSRLP